VNNGTHHGLLGLGQHDHFSDSRGNCLSLHDAQFQVLEKTGYFTNDTDAFLRQFQGVFISEESACIFPEGYL